MAKNDKKKVETQIDQQRGRQLGDQGHLRSQTQDRYVNSYNNDLALRDQITQGYSRFLDPDYIKNAGGFGGVGGVSGGINPANISNMGNDPYGIYKQFAEGRGMNPEFLAKFNQGMGNLDESMGGYRNFMSTGGFSPQELEMIRQNAMNPITGAFNSAMRNVGRNNSMTGAGGASYAAAMSQLAREQGRQLGDASVANEANMAQQIQQGKQFGTTGMAQASQAKMAASQAIMELDAQLRLSGAGGMTDIEKSRLQAELENAHLNQAASSANASLAQRQREFELGLPMEALGGLMNLYGTTPAATAGSVDDQLQLEGLSEQGNMGLIGQQMDASYMPSNFDIAMGRIGRGIDMGAKVATGFGAGGNIFSRNSRQKKANIATGGNQYSPFWSSY